MTKDETEPSETEASAPAEPQSTTAVIVLSDGGMVFKPSSDVVSATITKREEISTCLENKAEPSSLDTIHIIVNAFSVSSMYDPNAIESFDPFLQPGGELTVHVLRTEKAAPGEEDMGTVRTSLVMAGLRVQSEAEGGDGSKTVTGKKAGGAVPDEEEEEDSDEESVDGKMD